MPICFIYDVYDIYDEELANSIYVPIFNIVTFKLVFLVQNK